MVKQSTKLEFLHIAITNKKGQMPPQLLNTLTRGIQIRGQPKAKLLQLKLIHIFARAILLMKMLEFEKTTSTSIISVLKVEY